ncbi:MAG TPA: DUF1653 domain-containing protein [Candidatus Andersenbacteria bacterium]|nr:DUF1653 domain-containing protein [Candidatus Andersenbacteria bacterium]
MSSQSADSKKDRAQAELEQLPVKIGQVYTHYKGGEYTVIALALKEDTLEPLVIYTSPQHNNTVWARGYDDWNAEVEWEGKKMTRFTKK